MKKLLLFAFLGLLLANSAFAAPYTLTFTSTATTNEALPAGLNVGDSFEIFVVVDNGGTTNISQTWGFSDIQSVTFGVNGNGYIASFPSATFVPQDTAGIIQTDGAGLVSIVTADWFAISTAGNLDSNGAELDSWFINGSNDMIFYTATSSISIGAANSTNTDSLWAVTAGVVGPSAPATPVPTMSVWGLGVLAGLLGLIGFVRRRKA